MPRKNTKLLKFDQELFDELKPWQKTAFFELFNMEVNLTTITEIAEKINKSRTSLSQFYNSAAYRKIAVQYIDQKILGLGSLAHDAAKDILTDTRVNVQGARARVAIKVLEEAGSKEPPALPAGGNNVLNYFDFSKPDSITLKGVQDVKAKILKKLKVSLGNQPVTEGL
jgi:hypothetical protein